MDTLKTVSEVYLVLIMCAKKGEGKFKGHLVSKRLFSILEFFHKMNETT